MLVRNKVVSSTEQDVVLEFYGLPPIGQKQRRPAQRGHSFIARECATPVEDWSEEIGGMLEWESTEDRTDGGGYSDPGE
jgi:hypothetical protein